MDWGSGTTLERTSGGVPYLMIADRIERDIRSGRLKPDERLPATEAISHLLGVPLPTAQRGLNRLVQRGLLRRRPRHGTFVSSMIGTSTIALLTGNNPYSQESPFPRLILSHFHHCAGELDCHIDLHIGSDHVPSTGIRDLERSLAEGVPPKVIVAYSTSSSSGRWLDRLDSVPWLHLAGCDIQEMTRQGVTRLLADGVRDIAIFSTFPISERRTDELEGARQAFAKAGLPPPPDRILIRPGQLERDGYEAAKALLSDPKRRPKGLLINHDVLTRGALLAILECGLKVPDDLAVITHENKGAEIVSPFPMPRLRFDPEAVVDSTLEFILNGHLVNGKNTIGRSFKTELIG